MKRFFFRSSLVLSALLAFQTTASADSDKPVTVSELPSAAQAVLTSSFAKHRVALAKMDTDLLDRNYDVFFVNGDKVEFDRKGQWLEIVSKQDGVPTELVPAEILKYLATAQAGVKIIKIERERGRYEVTLANGIEYTFNKKFQVIDVDR